MQGWGCGRCKHCAALLYQLYEYKTCTNILQKRHVTCESGNNGTNLFSKLTFIKADQRRRK